MLSELILGWFQANLPASITLVVPERRSRGGFVIGDRAAVAKPTQSGFMTIWLRKLIPPTPPGLPSDGPELHKSCRDAYTLGDRGVTFYV